jgi:predicted lipoprotein with Yx(FWY)xxD motif
MKQTKIALLIAASIGATLLSGCGGSSNSTPEPTPTPAPAPTPDPAPAVEFPVQVASPSAFTIDNIGTVLTAENGLSLYYFATDENGSSSCNGVEGDAPGSTEDVESCAGQWPPALVGDGAVETVNFTFIDRADGTQQWSYAGNALYTFSGDSAQGEINGDGVGGVWDLARPTPLQIAPLNDIATYMGKQTVLSATSVGGVLEKFRADKEGFTLYTFDNDALDNSACNSEGCLDAWPPLLADNAAKPSGMLSLIDRVEGDQQWAYKGKALYFFTPDTEAGQNNGDNVGDVWHTATQEPAIFRTNDAGTLLTAMGLTSALLPNADNGDALEPTSVDKDQFTLYTFDNDTANTSNCNDGCAASWPPFLAAESEQAIGAFSKFARADGSMQWAYNESPLYFFAADTAKAQANGDGAAGVWHIVEPTEVVIPITTSIVANSSAIGESMSTDGDSLVLMDDGNGVFVPTAMNKAGFQLYTFDNDDTEQSNCTSDSCMSSWPALLASDTDTANVPFSIFTRDDGHLQWAINGSPLYYFGADTAAGQQNGEAAGNVWFVARPAPLRTFSLTSGGSEVVGLIAHGNVLASQGKTAEELADLTLYTFDDDTVGSGESTCFDSCAVTWPPLYASSVDEAFGEYEIISRTETDNTQTLQWTYKGQPLYFVEFDEEIGDTGGVYGTWHIALP